MSDVLKVGKLRLACQRIYCPPSVGKCGLRKEPHRARIIPLIFEPPHARWKHLISGGMPVRDRLDRIDVESGAPRSFAEVQVGSPDASHRESRKGFELGDIEDIKQRNDVLQEAIVPSGT